MSRLDELQKELDKELENATALVRISGKKQRLVGNKNAYEGKKVYQPNKKKEEWISPVPLIEVEDASKT